MSKKLKYSIAAGLIVVACVAVWFFWFNSAKRPDYARAPAGYEEAMQEPADSEDAGGKTAEQRQDEISQVTLEEQKIIKNAQITLEVPSPEEIAERIMDMVEENDGYIADASQSYRPEDEKSEFSITARVPSGTFSEFYEQVRGLGVTTSSRQWTRDVTEQYIDLTARLKNLESEEAALKRILERAETVEDTLTVRERLHRVRAEIDSLQGKLRHLENQTTYSTFHIQIKPETLASKAIRATGFENFFPRLQSAFIRGTNWVLKILSGAILAFTAALPALAVLTLIGWIIYRSYDRYISGS